MEESSEKPERLWEGGHWDDICHRCDWKSGEGISFHEMREERRQLSESNVLRHIYEGPKQIPWGFYNHLQHLEFVFLKDNTRLHSNSKTQ